MGINESIKVKLPSPVYGGHTHYAVYLTYNKYRKSFVCSCIPCSVSGEYMGQQMWGFSLGLGDHSVLAYPSKVNNKKLEAKLEAAIISHAESIALAAYQDEIDGHNGYDSEHMHDYIISNGVFNIK